MRAATALKKRNRFRQDYGSKSGGCSHQFNCPPHRPFRAASMRDSTSFGVRCSRSRGRRIGPEAPTFRVMPSGEGFGMAGTHGVLCHCHPALFAEGAFGEMSGRAATAGRSRSQRQHRSVVRCPRSLGRSPCRICYTTREASRGNRSGVLNFYFGGYGLGLRADPAIF